MTDELFTEEIVQKMKRRIYWATITTLMAYCFVSLSLIYYNKVNIIILFLFIIGMGYLNPDERIKGVSIK